MTPHQRHYVINARRLLQKRESGAQLDFILQRRVSPYLQLEIFRDNLRRYRVLSFSRALVSRFPLLSSLSSSPSARVATNLPSIHIAIHFSFFRLPLRCFPDLPALRLSFQHFRMYPLKEESPNARRSASSSRLLSSPSRVVATISLSILSFIVRGRLLDTSTLRPRFVSRAFGIGRSNSHVIHLLEE